MKLRFGILGAVLLTAITILSAADAPYIGKWKLNPEKSKLTGDIANLEKMPDGSIHIQGGDTGFTFKLDGMEYPMPDGGTTAWKPLDANTWERVDRANGKVRMTGRLSSQGDVLSIAYQSMKPDGGKLEGGQKWKRVSGGPGFLGKWRNTEEKSATTAMVLEANGPDGVTLKFPDDGTVCEAKFDGKDYPLAGPLRGGKTTLTLKKTGPSSFEVTEKLEGKPVYLDKYTVSGDGKTLMDEGTPVKNKEITKAVFDRL
jgi:hypothetical protein